MLSTAGPDAGQPVFSPSGAQLAFSVKAGSRRDIGVISIKGTEPRRVVKNGSAPDWSQRGRIAFVRVADADGTQARRVVRCSRCKTPAFSPDGRQMVYDGGGLKVVRVSDGKRLNALVNDLPGAFDALDPDWQPR